MTVDVATLVFEFKSDSAAQAEKAMDRLIERGDRLDVTAKKVRRATDSVNEAHRTAAGAAERNAQGAMALANAQGAVEKATRSAARGYNDLARSAIEAARDLREMERVQIRAARNGAAAQVAALRESERAVDRQIATLVRGSGAFNGAMTGGARGAKHLQMAGLDLTRQFSDLGVQFAMAAQSSHPLQMVMMALVQQGPQVGDRLALMKQQGIGLGAALRELGATIGILRVTIPAAATQALELATAEQVAAAATLETAAAERAAAASSVRLAQLRVAQATTAAAAAEAEAALTVAVAGQTAATNAAAAAAARVAAANEALTVAASGAAKATRLALGPALQVLGKVAGVVGIAVAGFSLLNRELSKGYPKDITDGLGLTADQLEKVKNRSVTFVDTLKASLDVAGKYLMTGPLGDGIRAVGAAISWLGARWNELLDLMTKVTFEAFARLTGVMIGTYRTVMNNWGAFPGAFGDLFAGAVNLALDGVERLVNGAADGLNRILATARLVNPLLRFVPDIPTVELDRFKMKTSGLGKYVLNAFGSNITQATEEARAGMRRLGAEIASGAIANAQARARKQAGDLKDALSGVGAGAREGVDGLEAFRRELDQLLRSLETPAEKAIREYAQNTRLLRQGLDLGLISLEQYREAFERLNPVIVDAKDAQKAWNAELVNTPADIKPATGALEGWLLDMEEAVRKYQDIRNAADELFYGIKNQDWSQAFSGLLRTLSQVQQAFSKTATTADKVNAVAGVADAVGNAVGGRGGKAISSAASAGATAFQATGNPYVAAAAAAVAGLSALLKAKPSNQGAGYSLVTGEFTGKSRTADTEKAAKAAADIISGGQELLRSAGLTLTETIHGLVIGSRDLSQVYTTGGRTVTAAVGDVAAAAEAGLRAVLETATYASAEQEKVAKSALAAGKSFDEVIAILDAYKAAQGILGSIQDEILRLQKPQAYDEQEVRREIQAQRDAAKSAYDAGYLTADMLAKINAELGTLEALRLDEVLARYANAANDNLDTLHSATESAESMLMDAYNAFAEAKRAEIEGLRQAAESLKAFRKELDFGAIAGRDPISQYAATKREFDRLNALSATDPERLANLQSVGQAFLEASRTASPTQLAFDRDLNAVRRATEASQLAATAQADLAQMALDAQTAAVGQLIQLNGTVISIAQAIANLTVARANEKAAGGAVNDNLDVGRYLASNPDLVANWNQGGILRSYGGTLEEAVRAQYAERGKDEIAKGLRTYATGGMHPGGLRLVGEVGPELEATGPARIYSARDTARMMGGDNSRLEALVESLTETVASQAQELRRIAVATDQTQNKLKDIEGNGMFVRGRAPDDPVPTKEAA